MHISFTKRIVMTAVVAVGVMAPLAMGSGTASARTPFTGYCYQFNSDQPGVDNKLRIRYEGTISDYTDKLSFFYEATLQEYTGNRVYTDAGLIYRLGELKPLSYPQRTNCADFSASIAKVTRQPKWAAFIYGG
ncbi:hypothetical protein [Williamsia sp. CHRR-6]|uniref:hypothetical protein n=1 Tax=Williamsia sp. CHRR-6 TaxID=2835871 RepID=UPI001BDA254A|nr:hypothetical protein [Williamsia sp. CHRR-6]MBT0566988.1 hypothetical protein [Williamsia sp. CHRR-6]